MTRASTEALGWTFVLALTAAGALDTLEALGRPALAERLAWFIIPAVSIIGLILGRRARAKGLVVVALLCALAPVARAQEGETPVVDAPVVPEPVPLVLPSPSPEPPQPPARATFFAGPMVVATTGESIIRPLGLVEYDAPINFADSLTAWRLRGDAGVTTAPGESITPSAQSFHFYAVVAQARAYRLSGNVRLGGLFGYVTRLNTGGHTPAQQDYVRYGATFGIGSKSAEVLFSYGHDGIISPDFRWGDIMAEGRVGLRGGQSSVWLFLDASVAVQSGLNANVYRFGVALDCGKALADLFGGGGQKQPAQTSP